MALYPCHLCCIGARGKFAIITWAFSLALESLVILIRSADSWVFWWVHGKGRFPYTRMTHYCTLVMWCIPFILRCDLSPLSVFTLAYESIGTSPCCSPWILTLHSLWLLLCRQVSVKVQAHLFRYVENNHTWLLTKFTHTCSTWKKLSLSPIGQANLPKCLYFICQTQSHFHPHFSVNLKSVIFYMEWLNSQASKSRSICTSYPRRHSLHSFLLYYWTAVLVLIRCFFFLPNIGITHRHLGGSPDSPTLNWATCPHSNSTIIIPMKTTLLVWDSLWPIMVQRWCTRLSQRMIGMNAYKAFYL